MGLDGLQVVGMTVQPMWSYGQMLRMVHQTGIDLETRLQAEGGTLLLGMALYGF
jgi:hypothetical protein